MCFEKTASKNENKHLIFTIHRLKQIYSVPNLEQGVVLSFKQRLGHMLAKIFSNTGFGRRVK